MNYYKVLGFDKEPFSTSPDPEFLYMSKEHETALVNTLIELNLQRGLSVILGEIGTGKTTLSRKLIQELGKRDKFLFQMILNPSFENEKEFMSCLMNNFSLPSEQDGKPLTLFELRDRFEKFLLEKTLGENKIAIVIVDEAQKLSEASLEALRVLLNYETNEFKLMQIVLLGQVELFTKISEIRNFYDRISFKFDLEPFNPEETKEMIGFRLKQAGYDGKTALFSEDAVREIHDYTQGYPRRITMLCHKALKELLLNNKYTVDGKLIKSITRKEKDMLWRKKGNQQRSNCLS